MSKLYEIPIYALSPDAHRRKVDKYKDALQRNYMQTHKKDNPMHRKKLVYLCCHPFQLWDYNHIVGYIVISCDRSDVCFDLYLQAQGIYNKSRYHWHSTQKWLLENQRVGGWHFRLNDKDSSEVVGDKIASWLDGMIKELVPKKYYVDKEAFLTMNRMVDYTFLMRGD